MMIYTVIVFFNIVIILANYKKYIYLSTFYEVLSLGIFAYINQDNIYQNICILDNVYKLVFVIIGYMVAPLIVYITSKIFYKKIYPISFLNYSGIKDIFICLYEEVLYRWVFPLSILHIICYFGMNKNIFTMILAFFIETVLFVLAHGKVSIIDFGEMFIYSILLAVFSRINFGLNIGLHIGRNMYLIKVLGEERIENEFKSVS